MKRNPKETAWRKSRKFGDVFGGRTRPKLTDGIFRRLHSFTRPADGTPLPILLEDNPSKDFFFPLDGREVMDALRGLPREHVDGITHLWLRRMKKADLGAHDQPLAQFVCGGGVRLIVLYPWPIDMRLYMGPRKPSAKLLNFYARSAHDLTQDRDGWFLGWTLPALRSFYVEKLLFHEVGHHVDHYRRRWSKANLKQVEEFAEQYAIEWSASTTRVHD